MTSNERFSDNRSSDDTFTQDVSCDSNTDHRFPVSHRLMHSHEFDEVFDQCEMRFSSSSLLLLAKQNYRGFNRLGMIVSKKSIPGSVGRNRVKRRIRETFRQGIGGLEQGWDVVVLTRPKIRAEKDISGLVQQSFKSLAKNLK